MLLTTSNPWRIVYANAAAASWLAVPADELVERPIEEFFEAAARGAVLPHIANVLQSRNAVDARVALKDGRMADVRFYRVIVGGEPHFGIVFRAAARRQDPLTGLPDRDFLMSRLAELLRSTQLGDQQFAVLFVDLDNFKEVNDRHGHLIGDSVLREAARRLGQCVFDGDHVVRFGGDEFVALLEQTAGPDEIRHVIDRIESAMAKPIALPGGEVTLSLSVGVAMASVEHRTPEELLAAADRAMYAAKRGGN